MGGLGADYIGELFGVEIEWWVSLIVSGLCFAIVYVFQSVGLFIIARREGYSNRWMAFIPFFNTYYIGVCGQKNKFFNFNTKIIAMVTAILEFVVIAIGVLDLVAQIQVTPYLENHGGAMQFQENFNALRPDLLWARWCYDYLYLIALPLELVYDFGLILILTCFFQTYAARRYFLFTITSIFFPVQGILIFAVRNNKGMRYADYMRAVHERMYRQYRDQQSFNQNPYNQNPYDNSYNNNPYSNNYNYPPNQNTNNQSQPQPEPPEDPFSELGSSNNKGPFDEFN